MIYILFILNSFTFNISPSLWPSRTAVLSFSTVMAPVNAQQLKDDLDGDGEKDWINEIKKGFTRWLEVNGVDFNLDYGDNDCGQNCVIGDGINAVYWVNPDDYSYPYPDKALGITFRLQENRQWQEADIVFNKNFDIALQTGNQDSSHHGFCILGSSSGGGPYTGCYDFPSIATHEIGHFLGLEHPSEDPNLAITDYRRQDTMYFSISYDETLLPLKDDDKKGIYCLYPEGEESMSVEECCDDQNPLLRSNMCSHSFSDSVNKSIITKDSVGGCGYTQKVDDDFKYYILLFLSPIFFLLGFRGYRRCS